MPPHISASWSHGLGLRTVDFILFAVQRGQLGLPFNGSLFVAWHFSFLAGVYAYWSWQRRCYPALGYGYAGLIAVTGPIRPEFAIAAVSSTVFILAAGQLNGLSAWLGSKAFQFLGQISYGRNWFGNGDLLWRRGIRHTLKSPPQAKRLQSPSSTRSVHLRGSGRPG